MRNAPSMHYQSKTPSGMLPSLREELTLSLGPVETEGAPTFTLHDPLRNRFFRLSWPAFQILSRWDLGSPEAVAASIARETPLSLTIDDVTGMVDFLAQAQLLRPRTPADTDRLLALAQAAQTSWFGWLLHHYLFFRLPLVHPDKPLERALPWVAWLGTKVFRTLTFMAAVLGVFLVSRQWDTFVTTLEDHLSLAGVISFGVALGLAKIAHELGHAFTAKAYRCRVPTMGVAFLVLWPVLYTDVSDAWTLPRRRQRLLVGARRAF
ncbi:MAG: hypothetical protein FD149_802 [Rhodospirillaceae bacterium]|nr:MAG: hypothetical protein FD149_802 [Rhodospirillaceae bacterium]